MRRTAVLSFFILCIYPAFTQSFERAYDIPVTVNGFSLKNPWAGGLNSCQISRIDANLDGKKDLFVFDRIGSRISIYLNMDDSPGAIDYEYTLEFNSAFPQQLRNWVFLRDMNCDGKEDICTNSGSGFKIYYNTSDTELSFSQDGGTNIQAFYDWGSSSYFSGVYCIAPDLPAFNDYDNDGDIDIWSWNEYSSAEFFYKNMAVENGNCVIPDFECRNRCYGMFGESSESFQLFLGDDFICDFNVSNPRSDDEGPFRHTGGTTLAVDLDQNGLRDLIIGDITENTLAAILMTESSSLQDSANVVHYDFPATFTNTLPAVMTTFLGAFYEDVNNDGISDLIVSPNATSDASDRKSLMLYINNGENDLPSFELVQDDFLQSGMIDLGINAYPVLFDFDLDGKKDLFIANRKYFEVGNLATNQIWYYRNTGTVTSPAFELIDDNWLNIPQQGWSSVYPSFGDLDGDLDADLLLGDQEGVLHYYINEAGVGEIPIFVLNPENLMDAADAVIDVGQSSTPQLIDLNNDGLNDLLIGELNGNINYLENIGSVSSYSFLLIDDTIGDVLATSSLGIQGKSVPHFFKNDSGNWELLLGTETGQVNHYDGIDGNLEGTFNLITTDFEGIDEGERCAVFLADINGDNQDDLFIGNIGGGVGVYTHLPVEINEQHLVGQIEFYPNPASKTLTVKLPDAMFSSVNLEFYDCLGKLVFSKKVNNQLQQVDISNLTNGVYLIRFQSENMQRTERLVIRK